MAALTIVIQVSAERTSFIKISRNSSNATTHRIYATMDRNICCSRLPSQMNALDLDGEEDLVNLEGHRHLFPHALLQIRWKGDRPRWMEELNGSVLVERVDGFSIYPHAVAVLVPSQVPKLPNWVFIVPTLN